MNERALTRPDMPEPRYMTPRDPSRVNLLKQNEAVAAARSKRLIPWQREAIALSTEIHPDTGTFAYSRLVITTPRQVGKTLTDNTMAIQNCLMGQNRRAWYTAQNGGRAREIFREVLDDFEATPIAALASQALRGNGSEALKFVNRSEYRPFVPDGESLHSKQGDRVTLDEVWSHSRAKGREIMQALDAIQSTRLAVTGHEPQLAIISTEGTNESEWYNDLLDDLRNNPEAHPETAFIDFGLRPGEDPDDLDLVARRHPGFGHLFNMASLRKRQAQYKGDTSGFARAYGNVRQGSTVSVIPQEDWRDGARNGIELPEDAKICAAAAVGVDNVDVTITITGYHPEYGKITGVLDWLDGVTGALARLKEMCANAGYDVPIVIDPYGPSAGLHEQAKKAGLNLIEIPGTSAYATACASVLVGLSTGEWGYQPHEKLDEAATVAARRWVQDGAWTWGRTKSSKSISALEAGTWSAWGIDHLPEETNIGLYV